MLKTGEHDRIMMQFEKDCGRMYGVERWVTGVAPAAPRKEVTP